MRRPLALLSCAVILAVALAGCGGTTPPSPLAAIPKLLIDYQDNTTRIYLTSVSTDVRYDNLTVSIGDANATANATAANWTFHSGKSFALVAETNLTFFTINATADESHKHYWYNATVTIGDATPENPNDPAVWQAYIQDTQDGQTRTEALPYRHVLAEG